VNAIPSLIALLKSEDYVHNDVLSSTVSALVQLAAYGGLKSNTIVAELMYIQSRIS
jgi:hypothetical protein